MAETSPSRPDIELPESFDPTNPLQHTECLEFFKDLRTIIFRQSDAIWKITNYVLLSIGALVSVITANAELKKSVILWATGTIICCASVLGLVMLDILQRQKTRTRNRIEDIREHAFRSTWPLAYGDRLGGYKIGRYRSISFDRVITQGVASVAIILACLFAIVVLNGFSGSPK